MPAEGSSGTGVCWWVREEPCPCLQVRCSLAVRGGSLLLAAVPPSAIALCLPLPPRGAGGELPEKGGWYQLLCMLRFWVERRGWSALATTAKIMPSSARPSP